MNALPRPTPADPADLDERILLAEHRLIAREEALMRSVDALAERVKGALQPRRLLRPAFGALLGVVGLGWLIGRGRHGHRAQRASHAHAAPGSSPLGRLADLPWVRLVGFAWPLLPKRLRTRVDPAVATALISIGIPLLDRLRSRRREAQKPLPTVAAVDLGRYAGTWWEVARLPTPFENKCAGQPSATYTLAGDAVEVVNRCPGEDGEEHVVRGIARVVPDSGGAKLRVSFLPDWLQWLPIGWADYWILYLDPGYSVALVGNPERDALWVLARRRRLEPTVLQAVVDVAAARGFPVERILVTQPAA